MTAGGWICSRCGVKRKGGEQPPSYCNCCSHLAPPVIGEPNAWLRPSEVHAGVSLAYREVAPGLMVLSMTGRLAWPHQVFLLRTAEGNVLWDCPPLLDDAARILVNALGGLQAIAISRPRFFGAALDWARAFDCSIHLHHEDAHWIRDESAQLSLWSGKKLSLPGGLNAHRFDIPSPGGTMLHWTEQRLLLTGDVLRRSPDGMIAFMESWSSLVPFPMLTVIQLTSELLALGVDRLYGAYPDDCIDQDVHQTLKSSSERHCRSLTGHPPTPE